MKQIVTKGTICVKTKEGIECRVCNITHVWNEDDTFAYKFEPNYSVISLLDCDVFQGIPGLNLDLKRKEYIRENVLPTFISERVPQENREDLMELLEEAGMDYMNPLEYLMKTKTQYFGDPLYVLPFEEKKKINIENLVSKENTLGVLKKILFVLGRGDILVLNSMTIDDTNRESVFRSLLFLYSRSLNGMKKACLRGKEEAKQNHRYKGRKPKQVDRSALSYFQQQIKEKKMSVVQACQKMNISRAKYYRLIKSSNDLTEMISNKD